MTDAIRIQNLCKQYDRFALKNVSFNLPQGSIMGFIGENGAGKTTTLKALLGLIRCESGRVQFFGKDFAGHETEIKEEIGVVFDESNFHDSLQAKDVSSILSHIYKNWDDALFFQYLRTFQLPERKRIKEFSRGMKTKLSIAAALAHHPKLLILDEATSGLDPVVREEILDIFLDFIQEEDHSVLISSHITSDLDKIADYITFIHQGQIVFSKPRDELLDDLGILKCSTQTLSAIDPQYIIRVRRGSYGTEALIKDKHHFRATHPGLIVDNTNTEEIMLFYNRGEEK